MSTLWLSICAANAVCFILFALDKNFAGNARRRIPETTLHVATLAFAAPAAWLAIFYLRHKNRRTSFMVVTLAITIVQLCAAYCFRHYF